MKTKLTANIIEIFSSIQGEGLYIGTGQIFVRFKDCNLKCKFCDTDRSAKSKNLSVEEVLNEILRLKRKYPYIHTISFTGGEPLLYVKFLKKLLILLKEMRFRTYLETNGTLYKSLQHIIDYIDIISMDIKLPSMTNLDVPWNINEKFLKACLDKEIFVKVVVSSDTKLEEFRKAIRLLKRINRNITFIIQPVSQINRIKPPSPRKLLELQDITSKSLSNVRIIPQVHKVLKLR